MAERRQFERHEMSEDALVVDARGRRLGRVAQAGGGGMLIALEPPAEEFTIGARLQVNILEPASNTAHTIDVVVRYCQPGALGVEFVSGP